MSPHTPPKAKQREECPHTPLRRQSSERSVPTHPSEGKAARGVSPHRRPRGEEGAADRDSFMRTGLTCMVDPKTISYPAWVCLPAFLGKEHRQGIGDEEASGRRNDAAGHNAHKARLAQLPDRRPGARGAGPQGLSPFVLKPR